MMSLKHKGGERGLVKIVESVMKSAYEVWMGTFINKDVIEQFHCGD